MKAYLIYSGCTFLVAVICKIFRPSGVLTVILYGGMIWLGTYHFRKNDESKSSGQDESEDKIKNANLDMGVNFDTIATDPQVDSVFVCPICGGNYTARGSKTCSQCSVPAVYSGYTDEMWSGLKGPEKQKIIGQIKCAVR